MKRFDEESNSETNNQSKYKPQRHFPFGVILKGLWSNTMFRIGIFSILFGIPMGIGFLPHSGLFSTSFNESDPVTLGTISGSDSTGARAGDEEIFEYNYLYKLAVGKIYTGKGYSTGNTLKRGDEIEILYKEKDPSKSKAVDLRTSALGGWGVFFGLTFQGFGLIILLFSIRKPMRQISILKSGEITHAQLLNKKATNMKIDKQTVYALTFEFTASDNKTYHVVAKSTEAIRLTDNKLEKLVYNPANPKKYVLVDALPEGIRNHFLKMIKTR